MAHDRRIALVTGANQGIGFETARQLAQQDVTVLLAGRRLEAANEAAAKLSAEGISGILPIQLDVTKADERAAAAQQIELQFERLDILVNNAAMAAPEGTLMEKRTSETSEQELQEVFNTNVFAVLLLTRELLPLLKKSDAGRIVNVSSQLGSLTLHSMRADAVAYNKRYAYNGAKAALNMLTIHLAEELEATNIKVNSVHPGWVKTKTGTEFAPMEPLKVRKQASKLRC